MATTERKPSRRTRERILEAALRLYNELGEPQVSTTLIAAELGISAGNLHYHFRRKDELTAALVDAYAVEMEAILPPDTWRATHVEDSWFLLHVVFETVWKHRFLFRDLTGLMARDRKISSRLKGVIQRSAASVSGVCTGLHGAGQLVASPLEIEALVRNIVVIAFYWIPFEQARDPRQHVDDALLSRGVYQVLMLVAPFLVPAARAHLESLARQYVTQEKRTTRA